MAKLRVKKHKGIALEVHRLAMTVDKLVYVLLTNRKLKYKYGKSRVAYIGTTKNGASRIMQSAATKAGQLLASYGVEANNAEGYLFPDTYAFDDQTRPRRVVERMLANWTRRYEEIERDHAEALAKLDGWSTHDIVTLASIVEEEAAVSSERRRIAGVFENRLSSRKFLPRRRLQADPTVQYGCVAEPEAAPSCDDYEGEITREMLDDPENPYNTYRHSGLPPGPISNPGKAALVAVIDPEDHGYYYFVARGQKRHHFSKTLRQHNIAVRRNGQR